MKGKVSNGKEIYYDVCRSFPVACKSPEYIRTTVVLVEIILVILSLQAFTGHIFVLHILHWALRSQRELGNSL